MYIYMHIYYHAHQAEPGEGGKTVDPESTKEVSADESNSPTSQL